MTRTVTIVRTLGAQHEAVEASRSTYGVELFLASGQQLVHVSLVADIKQKLIGWRAEYIVQRDGKFDDSQVRAEMAAVTGENGDQPFANLRSQLFQFGGRTVS